ncbi:hypothetical protein N7467_011169 [Penicillium canescens]|nr:hypothetical protein N7467_011169 [Penicillium canescens]
MSGAATAEMGDNKLNRNRAPMKDGGVGVSAVKMVETTTQPPQTSSIANLRPRQLQIHANRAPTIWEIGNIEKTRRVVAVVFGPKR